MLRAYELATKQNGYWIMGQLVAIYEGDATPEDALSQPDAYRRLDAAAIQSAARIFLKGDNRIQLTLVPETK